jgi:trimeric autotransporter adhesin
VKFAPKSWLRAVGKLFSRARRLPAARSQPQRLRLEELETRLTPSNVITTIAGNGSSGYSGDNGPATSAMLDIPFGTAVDSSGNVYIADSYNYRIREVVKATGNIITVAGTGSPSYNGDNIPAASANIGQPYGIAVDASGNLYIAD